ncbi:MAG: hypothetical protein IT370_15705 [Deltaproteobacteria bacterium]|nr:hypothetical protein [Deltaproteobacteria bacterium]
MACRGSHTRARTLALLALLATLATVRCTREPARNRGAAPRRTPVPAAAWGDAGVPAFSGLLGAPLGTPPAPGGRWALELRSYHHSFFGMERTSDVTSHGSAILDLAEGGVATACLGLTSKHESTASPYVTQDKQWEHNEYETKGGTTQHGSWRLDGPWLELRWGSFSHGCPATPRKLGGPDAGPPERFPHAPPIVVRCATVPARAPAPALLLACALPERTALPALAVPVGPTRAAWMLLARDPGLLVNHRTTTWIPQPPKHEALELTEAPAPIAPDAWSAR